MTDHDYLERERLRLSGILSELEAENKRLGMCLRLAEMYLRLAKDNPISVRGHTRISVSDEIEIFLANEKKLKDTGEGKVDKKKEKV
jgi:hypothetical protein